MHKDSFHLLTGEASRENVMDISDPRDDEVVYSEYKSPPEAK